MTEEEFNKKFARLEKAYEKIMAKMDAIDFNGSDDIDDDAEMDELTRLMDEGSNTLDKMCVLLDAYVDSSDTEV
ncbi:MAG: hypothetical protein J1E59_09705 [Treponema sp.]|nr:hypothetical protein [Treponema sp.]